MEEKLQTIEDVLHIVKSKYIDTLSSSASYKVTKSYNNLQTVFVAKSLSSITWEDICKVVNDGIVAPKLMLWFVTTLLDLGLYQSTHADALYRLLPDFKSIIATQRSSIWSILFCGDRIDHLYMGAPSGSGEDSKQSFYFIDYKNPYLLSLMLPVLKDARFYNRWLEGWVVSAFEESLGEYSATIKTPRDFNEYTFWHQIHFYEQFQEDSHSRDTAIKGVVAFYRFIAANYPDAEIFASAHSMSLELLNSPRIITLIKEGYYVTAFNMNEDLGDRERVIILLRGFDRFTTQLKNESFLTLNFSGLKSSFYRSELWKYYLSSSSVSVHAFSGQVRYIASGLQFLHQLKCQPDYPNPLPDHMTAQEAVLLKNYIYGLDWELGTKNNRLGAIRRFLMWENETNKSFTFDDFFFSYLTQYEEPSMTSGNAIPDEDLIALHELLVSKSSTDHVAFLVLTMFHIAIQTEFRISQICGLTTDCIHPTIKPNQFEVHSTTKTTHGRKSKNVITGITYQLLTHAITATEGLRESATATNKNYIFLYHGTVNTVRVMTSQVFRNYLRECCKELGLKKVYNAADLRDTHMTKSFEHILRNGKSDIEMAVLSRHKYLDTTKSHYIEMELEKMLEATYGIIIGDSSLIDPDKNLVDKLPPNVSGEDSVVQDGCGCCTADKCVVTSSLPCLACKYFVTTTAHEKFFIKAIENVDVLIARAKTPHDKEDFTTIKRLYVLYLKAIYKRKEAMSSDSE